MRVSKDQQHAKLTYQCSFIKVSLKAKDNCAGNVPEISATCFHNRVQSRVLSSLVGLRKVGMLLAEVLPCAMYLKTEL